MYLINRSSIENSEATVYAPLKDVQKLLQWNDKTPLPNRASIITRCIYALHTVTQKVYKSDVRKYSHKNSIQTLYDISQKYEKIDQRHESWSEQENYLHELYIELVKGWEYWSLYWNTLEKNISLIEKLLFSYIDTAITYLSEKGSDQHKKWALPFVNVQILDIIDS